MRFPPETIDIVVDEVESKVLGITPGENRFSYRYPNLVLNLIIGRQLFLEKLDATNVTNLETAQKYQAVKARHAQVLDVMLRQMAEHADASEIVPAFENMLIQEVESN